MVDLWEEQTTPISVTHLIHFPSLLATSLPPPFTPSPHSWRNKTCEKDVQMEHAGAPPPICTVLRHSGTFYARCERG